MDEHTAFASDQSRTGVATYDRPKSRGRRRHLAAAEPNAGCSEPDKRVNT